MDIATARLQLIGKHYNMLKSRNSWYSPDLDVLEDMNRDIARVDNFIETLDEIEEFLNRGE